jgi:hypothetical protein
LISNDDNALTSSVKSENLKEIWKILDESQSNSILNSDEFSKKQNNTPLKVTKIKPINDKTNNKRSISASPRSRQNVGTKLQNIKPKIRNYSIKN